MLNTLVKGEVEGLLYGFKGSTPVPHLMTEREGTRNGPCLEYKLTEAEREEIITRYGQPKEKWKPGIMRRVMEVVNKSESWEDAAEKLGMSVQRLRVEIANNFLRVPWGWKD